MSFVSEFLSRSEIKDQARQVAKTFTKRLPKERTGNLKLLASEFEIALGHMLGYKRKAKLGFFGVSYLVNGFRWGLVDAGYDAALVQALSRDLAMKLSATN